jgi:hypothetical protein
MKLTGTYTFYSDGKQIATSKNVITKFGRRFMTNVIAGSVDNFRRELAVGIGSTAATPNDTRLDFEWYRIPVLFGSTDIQTVDDVTTYSVIYKTTLPQNVAGEIKEIGLYPLDRGSVNNFDSRFLSEFSDTIRWYDADGYSPASTYNSSETTYSKIGDNVIDFGTVSGEVVEYFSNELLDLSGYSVRDSLSVSYYKYDANISSLRIRLYSSDTAYYQVSITPTAGTGHKISDEILFSQVLSNGVNSPDPSKIFKIGIAAIPTSGNDTVIGMDGLRINDEDTFDPVYGIISRSVLTDAVTKSAGRQLDVEYKLDLSYGE